MHTNLLKLVNHIGKLENKEIELIKSSFKPFSLAKGDFFQKAGNINKHLGFIEKGLVRYFVYKNDEESTFEFTKEGEFIADYHKFYNNQEPNAISKPSKFIVIWKKEDDAWLISKVISLH